MPIPSTNIGLPHSLSLPPWSTRTCKQTCPEYFPRVRSERTPDLSSKDYQASQTPRPPTHSPSSALQHPLLLRPGVHPLDLSSNDSQLSRLPCSPIYNSSSALQHPLFLCPGVRPTPWVKRGIAQEIRPMSISPPMPPSSSNSPTLDRSSTGTTPNSQMFQVPTSNNLQHLGWSDPCLYPSFSSPDLDDVLEPFPALPFTHTISGASNPQIEDITTERENLIARTAGYYSLRYDPKESKAMSEQGLVENESEYSGSGSASNSSESPHLPAAPPPSPTLDPSRISDLNLHSQSNQRRIAHIRHLRNSAFHTRNPSLTHPNTILPTPPTRARTPYTLLYILRILLWVLNNVFRFLLFILLAHLMFLIDWRILFEVIIGDKMAGTGILGFLHPRRHILCASLCQGVQAGDDFVNL